MENTSNVSEGKQDVDDREDEVSNIKETSSTDTSNYESTSNFLLSPVALVFFFVLTILTVFASYYAKLKLVE